jgi:hypothetical protein
MTRPRLEPGPPRCEDVNHVTQQGANNEDNFK